MLFSHADYFLVCVVVSHGYTLSFFLIWSLTTLTLCNMKQLYCASQSLMAHWQFQHFQHSPSYLLSTHKSKNWVILFLKLCKMINSKLSHQFSFSESQKKVLFTIVRSSRSICLSEFLFCIELSAIIRYLSQQHIFACCYL